MSYDGARGNRQLHDAPWPGNLGRYGDGTSSISVGPTCLSPTLASDPATSSLISALDLARSRLRWSRLALGSLQWSSTPASDTAAGTVPKLPGDCRPGRRERPPSPEASISGRGQSAVRGHGGDCAAPRVSRKPLGLGSARRASVCSYTMGQSQRAGTRAMVPKLHHHGRAGDSPTGIHTASVPRCRHTCRPSQD